MRKRLDVEDIFGQLGKQSQVSRLQTTAAQDAEGAVLWPLNSSGGWGGGGREGRGAGLLRWPVKVVVWRGMTAVRRTVGPRSEIRVEWRSSVWVVVRHDGRRNACGVSCRQKVSGKTGDVKCDLQWRKGWRLFILKAIHWARWAVQISEQTPEDWCTWNKAQIQKQMALHLQALGSATNSQLQMICCCRVTNVFHSQEKDLSNSHRKHFLVVYTCKRYSLKKISCVSATENMSCSKNMSNPCMLQYLSSETYLDVLTDWWNCVYFIICSQSYVSFHLQTNQTCCHFNDTSPGWRL